MLNKQMIDKYLELREDVLGSEEFMTTAEPISYNSGVSSFKPTYFETLGQKPIKGARCYSTGMTHQHPRAMVGPSAGGKVYDDKLTENGQLRQRVVQVDLFQFEAYFSLLMYC